MSILGLLILLAVLGVGLYLFNTLVTTIDPRFKTAINAIVTLVLFVVLIWWLLGFFGIDVGGASYGRPLRRC